MVVGLKDAAKLFGISIVACCAVFVCTMFMNYNIDLGQIEGLITSESGAALYSAQKAMGNVVVGVTGGCLAATSVVMLFFYIKNYIDTHGKTLGILKALGHSERSIALHFWVFGCSVLVGCLLGFAAAFAYMPRFYGAQNADGLLPEVALRFHPILPACLIVAPTVLFTAVAVLYAWVKLKTPVLDLLRENTETKKAVGKTDTSDAPFLKGLARATRKSKKVLAFFVAFSAFCFSAMVQMSISMVDISSQTFAWMILLIGLILAFMTLIMSLSSVVGGNAKTIAMMRVLGYENKDCCKAVLWVYRPIAYIGFVVGTGYQFGLLKLVMTFVFADLSDVMPDYSFDFKALGITLAAFVAVYELIMYLYSIKIARTPIKSVMTEY